MNTQTAARTLTLADVVALSTVVEAAVSGKRVRWLTDGGDILDGVARSIGDERGNFLRSDEDVRDGYLRVSGTFEHFLPVSELVAMVQAGTFALD